MEWVAQTRLRASLPPHITSPPLPCALHPASSVVSVACLASGSVAILVRFVGVIERWLGDAECDEVGKEEGEGDLLAETDGLEGLEERRSA